jgi:glycosyltransferase involved in cell wall biosynthesis
MMKHVTVDVRMINNSGIGTYIQNILPSVIDILKDYKFSLLIDSNLVEYNKLFLDKKNVEFIEFNSPIYSINEQFSLLRCIPKHTDLYWSPHYIIPLLYKGKCLVTVHDVYHLVSTNIFVKPAQWLYANIVLSQSLFKAKKIITVSHFSKYEIIRFTCTKATKIKVVYNGVNTHSQTNNLEKNPLCLPYLLFVGNVKPNKNLSNLMLAFESLIEKIPHKILIVGKKEGFINADSLVLDYSKKYNNRIQFTGFVDREELYSLFSNATALIFPSVYEGFGLPPLEAMALGCPVLASAFTSIPEICGDAALYFDAYDPLDIAEKILQVVSDAVLRKKLIDNGLTKISNYSWDKSAIETCEIIKEVMR